MKSRVAPTKTGTIVESAFGYAGRGWAVFPVHGIVNGRCTCGRPECSSPGKHPLVRRGLHEATTDMNVIKEWWSRWRLANVAVATGSKSGIVVIDIDLPRAFESLNALIHKGLPITLTSLTGGGGIHLLLRASGEHPLHNHASRLPGIAGKLPGIDLRGDGGYIIAPPSTHISDNRYEWLDPSVPIADTPAWLKEDPRRYEPIVVSPPKFTSGIGTERGIRILERQLAILRAAKVGERNHTLNRCAFILARVVASGELSESDARDELQEVAARIGLSAWETDRTISSGFGHRWEAQ
jgi:Bifunctional DNA primase/polymerase, N-terminal